MVKVKRDLTGMVFGRLTVIKQAEDYISPKGIHRAQWFCHCKCGEDTTVQGHNLTKSKGGTASCGCLQKELNMQNNKNPNEYEIQEDYVIMYTHKNEPFLVDLEDFWKVRNICWAKDAHGYLIGQFKGKRIKLHRLVTDCPDGLIPDHIHGKKSRYDNRKSNLRIVDRSKNKINSPKHSNNTSGITGVCWNKRMKKWQVRISINHKEKFLGYYDTIEEAARVRKEAENKYYGEFSYSNSQKLVNSS